MKIFLNQKEYSVESERLTVAELLKANDMPSVGVAVAVNNKIVRKPDWETAELAEGDHVTIITAVCGG